MNPCGFFVFGDATITATFAISGTPRATNSPPGEVAQTTAVLNGEVDANGFDATCQFQVTTADDTNFDNPVATPACDPNPVPADAGPTAVEAVATGLEPLTDYIYRVVATNSVDTSVGEPPRAFTTLPMPPIVTIAEVNPDEVTTTNATFRGTVDPEGSELSACRFEYVTEVQHASNGFAAAKTAECDPDAAAIGSGSDPVDVEATVTDLQPNVTYHVRLLADKDRIDPVTAEAQDPFSTPQIRPSITLIDAIPSPTAVSLYADINPNNQHTTYRFEYGLTDSYGNVEPVPDGEVGDGFGGVKLSQYVEGLESETRYHYRVIATNATGTTTSADMTFTTPAEPPERVYEQVTSEKNDADAMAGGGGGAVGQFALAAVSGDRLQWDTTFVTPYGDPSNGFINVLQSSRGSNGWTKPQSWRPPTVDDGNYSITQVDASANLDTVLLGARRIDPLTGGATQTSLIWGEDDGSFATIATWPSGGGGIRPGDAFLSADGSNAFFNSQERLVPEDTHGPLDINGRPQSRQVYAWNESDGLHLAGVDSAGEQISPCGSRVPAPSAVSPDGSRFVFQSPDPRLASGSGSGASECRHGGPAGNTFVSDLYLREGYATTEISKPPAGVADYGTAFAGASRDLSKVFFVTETALTADKATEGPGHGDLYRYDTASGELTRLSVGEPGHDDAGVPAEFGVGQSNAPVSRSAIASADGSTSYFMARGQLTAGEGASRAENQDNGTVNLYRWHEDKGVSFIATVSPFGAGLNLTSAVTPNGAYLVFRTTSRLTGYDNRGQDQLYRFDAHSGAIDCVTCNPTGVPPSGSTTLDFPTGYAQATAPLVHRLGGLSEDGSTVFFASDAKLLPGADDRIRIYEWQDGALSLVSSGTNPLSDILLGASPSGRDVFFLTANQLSPTDDDSARDIYDARIGGGFPEQDQDVPCTGDACQNEATPGPSAEKPGSSGLRGRGNLAENGFALAKVRRNLRRGTAILTVEVPGPGEVELEGSRKLRRSSARATESGAVRLKVTPKRTARRALRRRSKRGGRRALRVIARVTYFPEGGKPSIKTKQLRLVKRTASKRTQRGAK